VLRRIFGPKRDEVTGGSRKLCHGELLNLYSLPDFFWRRGSSVSIVSDYGLDDRAIEV
jgi:hypothetical protein